MMLKPVKLIAYTAIALFFCVTLPVQAGEEKTKPGDKVALVNDTVIPRSDFDSELKQVQQQMSMRGQSINESQQKDLNKSIVTRLIDQELLYQESRKKGVTVESQKVKDALADLKKGFKSEEDYKKAMAEMNISEPALMGKIEKSMVIKQLIDTELEKKVQVAEPEIKSFYESHPDYFKTNEQAKASHILIKVSKEADAAQKAKAKKEMEDIQARLKKGESFAELAKSKSQCPSSAKGGDLGFFRKGQMVKPFEDAAFGLEPGQTSGIVETEFGYHLIQLAEKKPAGTVSYEEAKPKITEFLKRQQMEKNFKQYLDSLRANAKIQEFI
ncbi:MAG: peptidylprolyl isomerase [Thermodesulfobacteriota bacterium]